LIFVGLAMIDNPEQVERLIPKLRESLPLVAMLTPEVVAIVREQSPAVERWQGYAITRVDYAGDEGGMVCKVDLGPSNEDRALFASITHLRFGQAVPVAREIAAYQKRRLGVRPLVAVFEAVTRVADAVPSFDASIPALGYAQPQKPREPLKVHA
jgi:hypothetical protein